MKKVLSTLAVMGLVIAATSTTAYAHGHGGSHHSSGARWPTLRRHPFILPRPRQQPVPSPW